MMNSVHSIISFEKKKSYRNKVSIYVFKYPHKKFLRQKVTEIFTDESYVILINCENLTGFHEVFRKNNVRFIQLTSLTFLSAW